METRQTEIIKALNVGLTFLLELTMLAAFGYWGFQGEKSVWIKWGLGIGTPLVAAILWGILLAPMANQRLNIIGGTKFPKENKSCLSLSYYPYSPYLGWLLSLE